jgi:hypothetical protein
MCNCANGVVTLVIENKDVDTSVPRQLFRKKNANYVAVFTKPQLTPVKAIYKKK